MLYIRLEEKLLPHLNNNKNEVQTVFSTAERSENLVSSHTLMVMLGFLSFHGNLTFIFMQSYAKEKNDTVGYIMITICKAPGAY